MTEVIFDCGHTTSFRYAPPVRGERVYCIVCTAMRQVQGTITGQGQTWIALCAHCSFRCARNRITTMRSNVDKHLRKHPEHVVVLQDAKRTHRYEIRHKDVEDDQYALFPPTHRTDEVIDSADEVTDPARIPLE
jgi:hypothetical protein